MRLKTTCPNMFIVSIIIDVLIMYNQSLINQRLVKGTRYYEMYGLMQFS